jgi:hypothetical protein
MNFREELLRATRAPQAPEPAGLRTPWDDVLDEFVAVLNEGYADALRAYRRDGAASGVGHIVVTPRGRRNHRNTLLVLHFEHDEARVLAGGGRSFATPDALQEYLINFVRLPAFRETVRSMRELAAEPVTGVLQGRDLELGARRPSTDILVTLAPEEQARLADACETRLRQPIELVVTLPGPSPAGRGTYGRAASLRWLVAGGYGLELDAAGGHTPEGDNMVRLRGTPIDPALLD